MAALLSIGEFSRVAHLSIKALRHYDDVALLKPVRIDPSTGYRYYATAQLAHAQVIRRLRDLDMPVAAVKAVLDAPDLAARNALIAEHLQRLERELVQTRAAVDSLRAILSPAPGPLSVTHRSLPATVALAITAVVERAAIFAWWHGALAELHAIGRTLEKTHAPCGIYATALFEHDRGEATLYLPLKNARRADASGRVTLIEVPAVELAVVTHEGPHDDVDVSYAKLAEHVSAHEIGVAGPLRELYLRAPVQHPDPADWLTELGWPIFPTGASAA